MQAKFKLVPVTYELTPVNSLDALNTIRLCSRSNIDPSYLHTLSNNLLYRHNLQRATIFGFIHAPTIAAITQNVIGSDGYYFKMTTSITGVDYIWHDRYAGVFYVWGSNKFKVVKALNALRWRIHKYTLQDQAAPDLAAPDLAAPDLAAPDLGQAAAASPTPLSDTDYSDMPDLVDCETGEIVRE
jgi:hypothetical protein